MTHHPVLNSEKLDDRFEYAVTAGPTWERLSLSLIMVDNQPETTFTVNADRGEGNSLLRRPSNGNCFLLIRGTVQSIDGSSDEDTLVIIKLVPILASGVHPVPLEVTYWPRRQAGILVDPVQRQLYS